MKPITAEWISKAEGDFAMWSVNHALEGIPILTAYVFMLSSALRNI
jgi:hypothetical protein